MAISGLLCVTAFLLALAVLSLALFALHLRGGGPGLSEREKQLEREALQLLDEAREMFARARPTEAIDFAAHRFVDKRWMEKMQAELEPLGFRKTRDARFVSDVVSKFHHGRYWREFLQADGVSAAAATQIPTRGFHDVMRALTRQPDRGTAFSSEWPDGMFSLTTTMPGTESLRAMPGADIHILPPATPVAEAWARHQRALEARRAATGLDPLRRDGPGALEASLLREQEKLCAWRREAGWLLREDVVAPSLKGRRRRDAETLWDVIDQAQRDERGQAVVPVPPPPG